MMTPSPPATLFAVNQGANETLWSNVQRFVHIKCQTIGLIEDSVIDAAKEGLLHGPLQRK